MQECWRFSDLKRPTFLQLCTGLEELLETEADYVDLSLFQEKHYTVLEPLTQTLDERL